MIVNLWQDFKDIISTKLALTLFIATKGLNEEQFNKMYTASGNHKGKSVEGTCPASTQVSKWKI